MLLSQLQFAILQSNNLFVKLLIKGCALMHLEHCENPRRKQKQKILSIKNYIHLKIEKDKWTRAIIRATAASRPSKDIRTMEVEEEDPSSEDGRQEMEVTSRKVNVKSGGKVMAVVREQYLRTDLSCQSSLCFRNCDDPRLPRDVTHYLIPFVDVAAYYTDLLELEQLTGIVLLQTVVNVIKFAQGGVYKRLLKRIVR